VHWLDLVHRNMLIRPLSATLQLCRAEGSRHRPTNPQRGMDHVLVGLELMRLWDMCVLYMYYEHFDVVENRFLSLVDTSSDLEKKRKERKKERKQYDEW
jgi:hypothetical protein